MVRLTKEQAKKLAIRGWNNRCNRCGAWGAEWTDDHLRPGWGSLALCPDHMAELRAEQRRHLERMQELCKVNFEQESEERPSRFYERKEGLGT